MTVTYQQQISTPIGYVRVSANHDGITHIGFYDQSLHNDSGQIHSNHLCELACAQLAEYFAGSRKRFDLPLAPRGTDFQKNVWQHLCKVEYGNTASYLDIATAIGNVKACRAVGAANGKNPIAIVVPCHRIIGATGKLTGYAGGLSRKSFLLQLEQA
ncbi:methylated-DNA--[protein]-cysteine S-methyltransferase [Glaciecola sp. 1036]|uniref:methylated-DNA--[protein]-cysteine S-methyltransferase n=1 Tax=Alteromonadaceae TaxID=72275 RepID=UPI003D01D81A